MALNTKRSRKRDLEFSSNWKPSLVTRLSTYYHCRFFAILNVSWKLEWDE